MKARHGNREETWRAAALYAFLAQSQIDPIASLARAGPWLHNALHKTPEERRVARNAWFRRYRARLKRMKSR